MATSSRKGRFKRLGRAAGVCGTAAAIGIGVWAAPASAQVAGRHQASSHVAARPAGIIWGDHVRPAGVVWGTHVGPAGIIWGDHVGPQAVGVVWGN